MPLDDKEQRILAEIERQFYEEDPELARAVQRVERPLRVGVRVATVGIVVGLAIIVAYLSVAPVAALGFLIVVLSANALVNALRFRGWGARVPEPVEEYDELDD